MAAGTHGLHVVSSGFHKGQHATNNTHESSKTGGTSMPAPEIAKAVNKSRHSTLIALFKTRILCDGPGKYGFPSIGEHKEVLLSRVPFNVSTVLHLVDIRRAAGFNVPVENAPRGQTERFFAETRNI